MGVTRQEIKTELKAIYTDPLVWALIIAGIGLWFATDLYLLSLAFYSFIVGIYLWKTSKNPAYQED